MANIKISELNELYEAQKDYNDYVPVVDTSADETKKISVKNLIRSNVQLVAVTDTEPAEYETGDKYYNTTDNRIYTATSSGWTNAETPIRNIFYVVISDKTTYTYDDDNETLISVGSASGSVVNNYSTSTTEGYSCNYVNNTIVNAYSESESNAYSCDYINPKVLWTNSSPTSSFASQNITLSSDDYDMFEIVYFLTNYTGYDNRISMGKIPYEQGKKVLISTLDYDGNSGVVTYRRNITMTSKTQFSVSSCEKNWNIGSSTANNYAIPLYIIGYKTGLF